MTKRLVSIKQTIEFEHLSRCVCTQTEAAGHKSPVLSQACKNSALAFLAVFDRPLVVVVRRDAPQERPFGVSILIISSSLQGAVHVAAEDSAVGLAAHEDEKVALALAAADHLASARLQMVIGAGTAPQCPKHGQHPGAPSAQRPAPFTPPHASPRLHTPARPLSNNRALCVNAAASLEVQTRAAERQVAPRRENMPALAAHANTASGPVGVLTVLES